MRKETEHKIQQ